MRDSRMESQLLFARNAISNALRNTNIKSTLVEYGYDDATIKSGRTLYEEAHTLHNIQLREYGEHLFVTDALVQARAEANLMYIKHLKLARIGLKKIPETIEILWMNEAKVFSLFGWLSQVTRFYNKLLNNNSIEIRNALNKVGLFEDRLQEGFKSVKAVESKLNQQLKKNGVAHITTKKRDEAFDEMNAWVTDFVEIASIALESKPQYLEMLGLWRA